MWFDLQIIYRCFWNARGGRNSCHRQPASKLLYPSQRTVCPKHHPQRKNQCSPDSPYCRWRPDQFDLSSLLTYLALLRSTFIELWVRLREWCWHFLQLSWPWIPFCHWSLRFDLSLQPSLWGWGPQSWEKCIDWVFLGRFQRRCRSDRKQASCLPS